MKKDNKAVKFIIFGIVVLFVLFVIMFRASTKVTIDTRSVDDWLIDTKENGYVVTVLGSTTCPHCQEYKPVLDAISKKYDINVYFFEINVMDEEKIHILKNTFNLVNYDNSFPYTFVVKNGEFLTDTSGYASRNVTIDFLKDAGIIK